MSCSSFDWKAYCLGALDPADRRRAEAHAATCPSCRQELATLRLTLDTLSTMREEEMPRRIAFVSDKVFQPRWWRMFLRPSFAAALVLAAAILVHAYARPDSAALQARIDQSVAKAVADTEQRHAQQMANLLADYEVMKKQNTLMYVRSTRMERQ
jgi:anti-sigma factor RsiW